VGVRLYTTFWCRVLSHTWELICFCQANVCGHTIYINWRKQKHLYIFVYIYVYAYTFMYYNMYVHIYKLIVTYLYMYMYIFIYECSYIHVYMYTCYIHICMYTYMYTHIHEHIHKYESIHEYIQIYIHIHKDICMNVYSHTCRCLWIQVPRQTPFALIFRRVRTFINMYVCIILIPRRPTGAFLPRRWLADYVRDVFSLHLMRQFHVICHAYSVWT